MLINHSLFIRQFKRESLLQIRQIGGLINVCLFFLIVLFIFPLTLKPEVTLMRTLGPGLVWVAVLLSLLLSAEGLFQQDHEQGVIELWLMSGQSLPVLISAKLWVHWCLNTLSLIILSPLVGLFFSLSPGETGVLVLSLICGTPAVLFLCGLASSFNLGVYQKGALMALILLPLTLPLLVFGSGIVLMSEQGLPLSGYFALLLAFSVLAAGLLPYAIAGVIWISHAE